MFQQPKFNSLYMVHQILGLLPQFLRKNTEVFSYNKQSVAFSSTTSLNSLQRSCLFSVLTHREGAYITYVDVNQVRPFCLSKLGNVFGSTAYGLKFW